jgi:hypothetical protein
MLMVNKINVIIAHIMKAERLSYIKYIIALQIALLAHESMAAEVTIHKNDVSGLLTWTVEDIGLSLELIQVLPDFVRAIYGKHNFSKKEVERVASYCVFGTIVKNTSEKHLSYRVGNWRYQTTDKKLQRVKTKTQWLEEWRKAGILFSWTILPDIGEFAVGDWQQGFTTINLPRNSTFDLIYKWQLDGKAHAGIIENISCAPETLPEDISESGKLQTINPDN